MPISKRLRFEILRRDNHTCRYCGASAPAVKLTIDHVIPAALGGSDEPTNLVAACPDCNAGKSSTAPNSALVQDANHLALRYREALQMVIEDRRSERAEVLEYRAQFLDEWNLWTTPEGKPTPLPAMWEASIDRFFDAGLDEEELPELIEITMHAKPLDSWRYFCACAWRRTTENQEIALRYAGRTV